VTSTPAGINCGTSCSGSYASGTTVTLTAAPATGSTFTGWSGGGGCSGTATCTVTVTAATTVTATFATSPSATLTVSKAGGGSGTVTSTPTGISCGTTCSWSYGSGIVVTLTAAPATGSTFTGWSGGGGCSGTATCTVTVTAATTVTATFALQSATALSVTPQSLTFTKTAGQPNPPAQTVTVTAAAGQVWTTHDTMPFISVTGQPFNGSDGVTGTGPGTFQVGPSKGMTSLAVGVYNGSITVSTAGAPNLVIPVQVIVKASSPPTALSVTPLSLTFTKTVGQPNPPAQTVTVTAAAGQVWTTHDTMPFISVTGQPFNGSDGVTGTGPGTFQVGPSRGMTSLAVGVYNGSITVSTAGAPNLVIPVQVIVTAP
jgi:hypothetical protein